MNVTLVMPYVDSGTKISTTLYPPLGLLYLAACIEDIVDKVEVLDANVLELDTEKLLKDEILINSNVVGISINITNEKVAKEIARKIKLVRPETIIIAGGPSPTSNAKKYLDVFDIVIVGEGEVPFRNIIKQLSGSAVTTCECLGVVSKDSEITHAIHPELEKIPFPAYHCLRPNLAYYSKKARVIKPIMAPILSSRGCPYSCTFCDKSVHGTNFRPRSIESVLKEIEWLYNEYGVRQIDILDDNFTFDISRAEKILDGIIRIGKMSINCQNGLRADKINIELVRKMKAAGVFRVGIGIESGNAETINLLNKKLDLSIVEESIRMFRRERITVHGFFIIGLPYENEKQIEKTIRYAIKVNPHFANFSRYLPIEGTPIYTKLKNNNQLTGVGSNDFFSLQSPIVYDTISSEKVNLLFQKAWKKFYLRPYKLSDIIMSVKSIGELMWILRVGISVINNIIYSKY